MAMVAPTSNVALRDAEHFLVDAGGAESNVAAHVAALGHPAAWFSHLGADALGERVAHQLARRGVDVSAVVFDPDHPTGVYIKDPGRGVSYYRAGSAASHLTADAAERVDLDAVALLHVSGITAAISPSASEFLIRIMERARSDGILIGFDVNFRSQLWDVPTAAPALASVIRRADVVFTGRDEAEMLWGTTTAESVRDLFPDVAELVVKDGSVGATTFAGGVSTFEPCDEIDVIDAVGAGDAFAGGYLAALLAEAPVNERLRSGHKRAALTLRTTGDSLHKKG